MLDIYVTRIKDSYADVDVYPPNRQEIINNTKNIEVKRERIGVWCLLEYGIKKSLGKRLADISPYLDENGKWLSNSCFFSLSHSNGVAVVAISDALVGIDIECKREIDINAFSRRIFTESERKDAEMQIDKNKFMIQHWTKKESIYKMIGKQPFIPSNIECSLYPVKTIIKMIDGYEYYISVCSDKTIELQMSDVTL